MPSHTFRHAHFSVQVMHTPQLSVVVTRPKGSESVETHATSGAPFDHWCPGERNVLPREPTDSDFECNELSDAASDTAAGDDPKPEGSSPYDSPLPSGAGGAAAAPDGSDVLQGAPAGPEVADACGAGLREDSAAAPHAAHSLAICVALIQEALLALGECVPCDTPSPVLRDMLAYLLHAKYNWPVRFYPRGPARGAVSPRGIGPWLEDVLVVAPSERVQCVVDLNFRAKFAAGDAAPPPAALGAIPVVYMGSLPQLTADLQTWMAPLERTFAQKRRTLPPWRQQGTLLRMYAACVGCDATPCYACLRDIGLRLAQGPGCGGGRRTSAYPQVLDDAHLVWLRTLLGPVAEAAAAPPPPAAVQAVDDVPDGYFDKEEGPAPVPADTRSGLSVLMDRASHAGGPERLRSDAAEERAALGEGAQETDAGWLARALLWW